VLACLWQLTIGHFKNRKLVMIKITSVSVPYLVLLPSVPLVTFKVAHLHCRWDGAMNGIF